MYSARSLVRVVVIMSVAEIGGLSFENGILVAGPHLGTGF